MARSQTEATNSTNSFDRPELGVITELVRYCFLYMPRPRPRSASSSVEGASSFRGLTRMASHRHP